MQVFLAGVIAFALSWAVVPSLRKLAVKLRFVDMPNQRKVHRDPLPMLGGVGIFAGFLAATFWQQYAKGDVSTYVGILLGATLLFLIGLVDDFFKTRSRDFPAWPRLIVQIISASLVAIFGGTIHGFTVPFGHVHYVQFPAVVATLCTILWVVGVINVFNFLDGLDGLAAGIAAISAMTLLVIALIKGQTSSALWAISLCGACLGFLRHNFYPARIIMGDAGSTVIGFLLASIALVGAFKSATVISIFVPILALGVPILDGLRVVVRRAMKGQPPHRPDKTHGHHRLLNAGFSQVLTVTMMYLISVCFSLVSVIVMLLQK